MGECIALYDFGRGHFTYHTNWYWAALAMYIPGTNRTFALNMGEGLGHEFHTKDKAYEDFAVLDGKLYKLGQTRLTYDRKDLT